MEKIAFILIGALLTLFGLMDINPSSYSWFVKKTNEIQGIKTEITPTTILYGRIRGIIDLFLGLLLISFYFLI